MTERHIRLLNGKASRPAEELTDDDLMLLVRAGREDAFEVLLRRHQRLVLGLAIRFLGDRGQGRDVAQDVFLALWAERDRYRPRGRFRSYLVSVTLHRCHVVARQRKSHLDKVSRLQQEREAHKQPETDSLDRLVEVERARLVREKMTGLPEKMRLVLILRFTNELALEEIAEITGLPLGTVKSHVFRGLRRLSRWMAEEAS
jgi:RNA polymerase sigma-70 factor (ECF subfamily)